MITTNNFLIRNLDAERLQENFLIASISSIFFIRFFLFLTDYPQFTSHGLHIAHMLWGGMLMLVAFIMLMSFLSRTATNIAVVVGGIGFGIFIDEVGKFVTSDNNYFFRPSFAIIYVIFILIYVITKAIHAYGVISQKEYLINAIEMTKEIVINDLDIEEKRRAYEYLKKSDPNDPLVKSLSHLLDNIATLQKPHPNMFIRIRQAIRNFYLEFVQSLAIAKAIIGLLVVQVVATIGVTMFVLLIRPELTFDEWGKIVSSVISAAFILLGLLYLRSDRLQAFHYFKLAIFVTILLTQFFVFFTTPFIAVLGVLGNITLLFVVDYAIDVGTNKDKSASPHAV